MQSIGAARKLRMAAIHRQRVLRQIIAADREKFDFAADERSRQRGRRRLDHRAKFDAPRQGELA